MLRSFFSFGPSGSGARENSTPHKNGCIENTVHKLVYRVHDGFMFHDSKQCSQHEAVVSRAGFGLKVPHHV